MRAQALQIQSSDARRTLIKIRKTLHKYLGAKVTAISHKNWLNESVLSIETKGAEAFFYRFLSQLRPEREPLQLVKPRVHVANITQDLLNLLSIDPNAIYNLNAQLFEELICDRLYRMGFELERVGNHTFHKDGGIDVVAWQDKAPYLLAIQAKYHHTPRHKTGPVPVRDLLGTVHLHSFNAGVLITNTTFTPDAKWIAAKKPQLLRLKDIEDIQKWLANDFYEEDEWQEIEVYDSQKLPTEIEFCPGKKIYLPRLGKKTP